MADQVFRIVRRHFWEYDIEKLESSWPASRWSYVDMCLTKRAAQRKIRKLIENKTPKIVWHSNQFVKYDHKI